jgi:hypothetical protein
MKLSIPEIIEILMTQAEDDCHSCASGSDPVRDQNGDYWHSRNGVGRPCRAQSLHLVIRRLEVMHDLARREATHELQAGMAEPKKEPFIYD